jgi:hypothetical protein
MPPNSVNSPEGRNRITKGFGEKERKFWTFLNEYITDNEGFITSQPNTTPIRFECWPDSILPKLLNSMGFDVFNAGLAERLMPISETRKINANTSVTTQQMGPATLAVYQFWPKQFEAALESRLIPGVSHPKDGKLP